MVYQHPQSSTKSALQICICNQHVGFYTEHCRRWT